MPESKAPPIGRLRNYAEIFEWRDAPEAAGPSVVPGYTSIGHCWCSLKVKQGEMFLGPAQIGEVSGPRGTHTVRTRFRQDLTLRHMMEIAGMRYRVVSVSNDDARRYTQCEVEEYGDATVIGVDPAAPPPYWDTNIGDGSVWDDSQSLWDGRTRP